MPFLRYLQSGGRTAWKMAWTMIPRMSSTYFWPSASVELFGGCSISCFSCLRSMQFFRFIMNTPKVKVKLRKCRPLDAVAHKEKDLSPIIRLRDLMLKFKKTCVPLRVLLMKRKELRLKMSDAKVEALMKRYPNIFTFFIHPDDKQQWCKLSPKVMELIEEEQQMFIQEEASVVEKLQRLLMLSRDHRIPVNKLRMAARLYGFPESFDKTLVPKYPQYFRLVAQTVTDTSPILELIEWDEILAVTEFERKLKAEAKEKGLGDIQTRRTSSAFKLQYSRGMVLRKKEIERINKMQKLPYISPYEKTDWITEATPLFDRMMVARLHELVSLTVEKKLYIHVIKRLREEFSLPLKVAKTFNRFPGVFYISLKGGIGSIFLREAYEARQLLEGHPVVDLKAKYHKLLMEGPQLKSLLIRKQAMLVSAEDALGRVDCGSSFKEKALLVSAPGILCEDRSQAHRDLGIKREHCKESAVKIISSSESGLSEIYVTESEISEVDWTESEFSES